ncbi:MAG: hypothetical protein QXM80_02955 [Thermofilaceae archaeon]
MGIVVEGYRLTSTPVVFGSESTYLLGSVTMEALSLAPDVVRKRLVPAEALLMSSSSPGMLYERVLLAHRRRRYSV